MFSRDPGRPDPGGDSFGDPIADELIGLDPDDPETRAFAEHLGRMHNSHPGFTVEGYLRGVSEFADSANRARGGRRLGAVVLVVLLLVVTLYLIANALGFVVNTWFAAGASSRPGMQVSGSTGGSRPAGTSVEV